MKVAVKDLRPNPFKPDIPLDEEKIKTFEKIFREKGGVWGGIIQARKKGNIWELVFAHHRRQAAENIGIKEIDITPVDIDDLEMLQRMGFENNEEWSIRSPAWAMGFIESVYKKLLEQKQWDTDHGSTAVVTYSEIEGFTKWPTKRIEFSLAALRSAGKIPQAADRKDEEQPAIDEKILTGLPTIEHTAKLRRAVKKTWRDGMGKYIPPKSKEEEKERKEIIKNVAKQVKKETRSQDIESMMLKEKLSNGSNKDKSKKDLEMQEISKDFEKIVSLCGQLDRKVAGFLFDAQKKGINRVSGINRITAQFQMLELIKNLKRFWDYLGGDQKLIK